jgi:ABC-type uncharacterized transport system fused permease/ATPase subunit
MFGGLVDKNWGVIFPQLIIGAIIYIIVAILQSITIFGLQVAGIDFRKKITEKITEIYFKDRLYYKLIKLDNSIDNPDQRIASDIGFYYFFYTSK